MVASPLTQLSPGKPPRRVCMQGNCRSTGQGLARALEACILLDVFQAKATSNAAPALQLDVGLLTGAHAPCQARSLPTAFCKDKTFSGCCLCSHYFHSFNAPKSPIPTGLAWVVFVNSARLPAISAHSGQRDVDQHSTGSRKSCASAIYIMSCSLRTACADQASQMPGDQTV